MVVRLRILAVLRLGEVDGLRLQLVLRAVVHAEAFGRSDLVEDNGDHEDDGSPEVGAEAVSYGQSMQPLSFAVETVLGFSALLVVLQDALFYLS